MCKNIRCDIFFAFTRFTGCDGLNRLLLLAVATVYFYANSGDLLEVDQNLLPALDLECISLHLCSRLQLSAGQLLCLCLSP